MAAQLARVTARDGRGYVAATLAPDDADSALRTLCARHGLTPAEGAVLVGLGAGLSNAEIARSRGASLNTVRNQVASVLDKLGVHTRVQAALIAAGLSRRA